MHPAGAIANPLRNFNSQIRLLSFRRISPHFTSVFHMNIIFFHFSSLKTILSSFFRIPFRIMSDTIFFFFFFFFFFLQSLIHTSHPLEQLRTSYPNPLYPSRNLRVFESLRYETSLNVHKNLLIPRYSLPHVKSLLHSFFFFFLSRLAFLASIFFFDI